MKCEFKIQEFKSLLSVARCLLPKDQIENRKSKIEPIGNKLHPA
jgi:hypothetical protein